MSNALYYEDCALNYTQSPLDDSVTSGCKGWSSAKIQGEMDKAHCTINNTIQSCYDGTLSCINSSVSSINTDLSNKYAICCDTTVKIGACSCVGNYGVAIGYSAGSYSSNYQYTVAVGVNARALGNYGVAIGYQAGASFTGSNNLAIGTYAMYGASGATGCNNTAIGYNALRNIRGTANNDNTAIGSSALQAVTTGLYNTAIGARALCGLTTGCENFGLGIDTGWAITTGCNNTLIGNNTGMGITGDSSDNTLIGKNIACASSCVLCAATIIGSRAAPAVTGGYNTIIGYCAATSLTSGAGNTFVGFITGSSLKIGRYNTILGYGATIGADAADNGTAIGVNAQTWENGIAIGPYSCIRADGGIAIGDCASSHRNGIAIGCGTCSNANASSNGGGIAIGYKRCADCCTVSIGTLSGTTDLTTPIKIEACCLSLQGFYFEKCLTMGTVYSCIKNELSKHSTCPDYWDCESSVGVIGYFYANGRCYYRMTDICFYDDTLYIYPSGLKIYKDCSCKVEYALRFFATI